MNLKNDDGSEDSEEEEAKPPKLKFSAVRPHLDNLLKVLDNSSSNERTILYGGLW